MSQVFISHSTQDDEVVEALRHSLDRLRVFGWTDSRRMQPGDAVDPNIELAIQHASHFVVVISAQAMKSPWVEIEVAIARRVRDEQALFNDRGRGQTFGGELTMHDWFVPVLFQERPDPVLFHRTGNATFRAVSQRARKIALGGLPPPPEHSFVGRSRELLAAERLLCGQRMAPDHGAVAEVVRLQTSRTLTSPATSDAPYAVFRGEGGEGGEGKTTLAVELARWLVEQEASLHSVLSRLGRQLVADYVARSANEDQAGLRLIEEILTERPTLLVIDNLESIVAADSSRRPEQAPRSSGTESSDDASQNDPSADASAGTAQSLFRPTEDVLAPLFDLLSELNQIGHTRVLFTTRTRLPAPFDANHIRIDRLSPSDAVELVGNVLQQSSRKPQSGDAGESEADVTELVKSVNCHARSLVLLAREVSERGVKATTANLRELMQTIHECCGDDRERSLFASVELSLRRLPPDIRAQLPPLAVFHGTLVHQALATGETAEATTQLEELVDHPGFPNSQPMIKALLAILSGSRDPALAADPRLASRVQRRGRTPVPAGAPRVIDSCPLSGRSDAVAAGESFPRQRRKLAARRSSLLVPFDVALFQSRRDEGE